jgi:AraC-like DNA-binding protein/transcriptional antiterminator Rof (Rho-off)
MKNEAPLKEARKHGDDLMPVRSYSYSSDKQIINCHWHDEMEFLCMTKGKMTVNAGGERYKAEKGDILFFNSGELHAADAEGGIAAFHAVVFSPKFLASNDIITSKYILPIVDGSIELPKITKCRGRESVLFSDLWKVMQKENFAYEIKAKADLMELIYCFISDKNATLKGGHRNYQSEIIKKAIGYIDGNYMKQISSKEIADVCMVSEGYFCRIFRKLTLRTPGRYINSYRINKAIELLIETDRKITDIAEDCGFIGLSYFISVFRTSTGMTPAGFRKKYHEKDMYI